MLGVCLNNTLTFYTCSRGYLGNMVVGADRIDLEGKPTGIVVNEKDAVRALKQLTWTTAKKTKKAAKKTKKAAKKTKKTAKGAVKKNGAGPPQEAPPKPSKYKPAGPNASRPTLKLKASA
jgi:sRNA-binding protein